MTDVEVHNDYGQLGVIKYDEERQSWRKTRAFATSSSLHCIGGERTHIDIDDHSNRTEPCHQDGSNGSKHLLSNCPELSGSGGIIKSILSGNPVGDSYARRQSLHEQIVEFGEISTPNLRSIPVLALSTGIAGDELTLARGRPSKQGWERDFNCWLETAFFDQRESTAWSDGRGQLLQICFSATLAGERLLLAVRYHDTVSVLNIGFGKQEKSSHKPRRAFYIKPIEDFNTCKPEIQDVIDISFIPREPYQLLSYHRSGYIRSWKLSASSREQASLIYEIHHDLHSPSRCPSPCQPGILGIARHNFLATDGGQQLILHKSGNSERSDATEKLELPGAILDLRLASGLSNLILALTTSHLVWIVFQIDKIANKGTMGLLQTWAHHRDASDNSLSISQTHVVSKSYTTDNTGSDSSLVILYSRRNMLLTIFQYVTQDEIQAENPLSIQILDPVKLELKPPASTDSAGYKHFEIIPAPLRIGHRNAPVDSIGRRYEDLGLCFFQGFHLLDRTLSSFVYFQTPPGAPQLHVDDLSWRRRVGPRAPLSGPTAEPSFVVDSKEDSEKSDREDAGKQRWWEQPRRSEKDMQASEIWSFRYTNLEPVYETLPNASIRPPPCVRPESDTATASKDGAQTDSSSLLTNVLRGVTEQDDIFCTSDEITGILHPGVTGSPNEGPFNSVPLSADSQLFSTIGPNGEQITLAEAYVSLVQDMIPQLSSTLPISARVAFEARLRLLVTRTFTSGCIKFPPSQQSEPPELGQRQPPSMPHPDIPSSQTTSYITSQQIYPNGLQSSQPVPAAATSSNHDHVTSAIQRLTQFTHPSSFHDHHHHHQETKNHLLNTTQRTLNFWAPTRSLARSSSPPTDIDVEIYEADRRRPPTEAQLAESQRQQRKIEKATARRRELEDFEERERLRNSQRSQQPATQRMGFGSQQPGSQRPGFSSQQHGSQRMPFASQQGSQRIGGFSSQKRTPFGSQSTMRTPLNSQSTVGLESSQLTLPTPVSSQVDVQSQVGKSRMASTQAGGSSVKRSSQVLWGGQVSQGLPERKKRKAGF